MPRKTREDIFIEKLSELLQANRAVGQTAASNVQPAVPRVHGPRVNTHQAGQRGSGSSTGAARCRSSSGAADQSQMAASAAAKQRLA